MRILPLACAATFVAGGCGSLLKVEELSESQAGSTCTGGVRYELARTRHFVTNEPLLSHTLRNCTNETVWVNKNMAGGVEVIQSTVGPGGEEAGRACTRCGPKPPEYVRVDPGKTFSVEWNPFACLDVQAGTKYRVRATYRDSSDANTVVAPSAAIFRGPVDSNVLLLDPAAFGVRRSTRP